MKPFTFTSKFTSKLLAAFCAVGLGASQVQAAPQLPSSGVVSLDSIPVCYDFGCKKVVRVRLSEAEWRSIADWFVPPAKTPHQERNQIRNAIGWMEVIVGRHTPTHKDVALDLPSTNDHSKFFPGQLDCIDEAVNTTAYLNLFAKRGLLSHHEVIEAAYRRSWFDQHWAGQVRDKQSGVPYAVDSWFQPNGHLPAIQNTAEWSEVSRLTSLIDTSPDEFEETETRNE